MKIENDSFKDLKEVMEEAKKAALNYGLANSVRVEAMKAYAMLYGLNEKIRKNS